MRKVPNESESADYQVRIEYMGEQVNQSYKDNPTSAFWLLFAFVVLILFVLDQLKMFD